MTKHSWHTAQEHRILKKLGAKPHHPSYDGIKNGRPIEIRSHRKDNRYRIAKDCHKAMVQKNGYYVFVDSRKTKKVSAKRVSKIMGSGKWYKDRKYPHKFVKVNEIW